LTHHAKAIGLKKNSIEKFKALKLKFSFFFLFQIEQIQAEYKVLALQYHPDKNEGDKDAESKFQKMKVSRY
jgi:carbamoylphosphate synthase small subunit